MPFKRSSSQPGVYELNGVVNVILGLGLYILVFALFVVYPFIRVYFSKVHNQGNGPHGSLLPFVQLHRAHAAHILFVVVPRSHTTCVSKA